ncbi:nitroreductase/quinone reductase family protein [Mycobacterium sp.]|jgi:deazaflavin-dependent oxidoreductase (nitroreductase family)|uniref:nitroreductase/quinone reductase family protein n=1 Tax=Mycobacterium sp. TaxID=1785 RepID=UPI003F9D731E
MAVDIATGWLRASGGGGEQGEGGFGGVAFVGDLLAERLEARMRYRAAGRYRPPPTPHRLINRAVGALAARGWTPATTVALDVPGRRSGRLRRTAVVSVDHNGRQYLVSLGGESEWVRNVRAAAGRVTLRHGESFSVRLIEIPSADRPPVLRAYANHRAFSRSPAYIARNYFGVRRDPSLSEFAALAERYPVFLVEPG